MEIAKERGRHHLLQLGGDRTFGSSSGRRRLGMRFMRAAGSCGSRDSATALASAIGNLVKAPFTAEGGVRYPFRSSPVPLTVIVILSK
jgi:hypothetical protein